MVETDPDVGARAALVVAGDGWHRGVIGIVASRLVDAFHRPAIVISIEGDTAHGSCRSIPGFDMLEALTACAEHLDQFGGHRAAAGLTMGRARIRAFREAMTRWADDRLGPDQLRPRLRIDGQLGFRQITPRLYDGISQLAPFGVGNPKPTFWTPAAAAGRRPAADEGAAPEHEPASGRGGAARRVLARRRTRPPRSPRRATASTWPTRSSGTRSTASRRSR